MIMLYIGHLLLGSVAGVLTGMSQTAVVGVVLPALLAFGGGSVLSLSVAEGASPEDLGLLGTQMVCFAVGTVLGLIIGMALAKGGRKLPFGP